MRREAENILGVGARTMINGRKGDISHEQSGTTAAQKHRIGSLMYLYHIVLALGSDCRYIMMYSIPLYRSP